MVLTKNVILSLQLLKILIIHDLTLVLEVPTTSAAFPMASAALLLKVSTVSAASIVSNLAARVESSVEATAASIQHLEEVPTTLTGFPILVPTAAAT
jgi:hypothetical protein